MRVLGFNQRDWFTPPFRDRLCCRRSANYWRPWAEVTNPPPLPTAPLTTPAAALAFAPTWQRSPAAHWSRHSAINPPPVGETRYVLGAEELASPIRDSCLASHSNRLPRVGERLIPAQSKFWIRRLVRQRPILLHD